MKNPSTKKGFGAEKEILKKVQEILYPKIGEVIASSSIRVNCQRMGINPDELTEDKLNIFADNMKVSLLLFLDESEAEEISQKIKEIQ
ncbi:MAG: hypothetical protein PHI88_01265 [Candidatus Pacebacteria bacterium]|jgi:hypothetical protein|nr:hypothetical protein [Candidatus Paceibacterota bacterium]